MAGRVVITLEAQTVEAQRAIQQFAKATTDAFDKVKAGDPVLASSGAKVRDLGAATKEAGTASENFARQVAQVPGPVGQAAGAAERFRNLLTGPVGLVVGLAAVVTGLITAAVKAAAYADEMGKMSQKTGVGVETLSSLSLAVEKSDASVEQLAVGLAQLQRTQVEASRGTKEYAEAYQRLGVSVRDSSGQLKGTERLLEEVSRAIIGIRDPAARTEAAMRLLGRSGAELMPLLNDLATRGFGAIREEAEKAGRVITEEMAERAERFNDQLTVLTASLQGLTVAVGGPFLTFLTDVAEGLTSIAQQARTATTALLEFFGAQASRGDAKALKESVEGFLGALKRIRELADQAAAAREDAAQGGLIGDLLGDLNRFREWGETVDEFSRKVQQALAVAVRAAREEQAGWLKEIDASREALRDWAPDLEGAIARQAEWNRQTDASVGFQERHGEALGAFEPIIKRVLDHYADATLRLTNLTAEEAEATRSAQALREAWERMAPALEAAIDQIEDMVSTPLPTAIEQLRALRTAALDAGREQEAAAILAGDAWGAFTAGFQLEAEQWGTTMEGFATLGHETAVELRRAFSDNYFAVMQGELGSLEDAWKRFFNNLLRIIADFLAAETVRLLLDFYRSGGAPTGTSPGGSPNAGNQAATTAADAAGKVAADNVTRWIIGQSVQGGEEYGKAAVRVLRQESPDLGRRLGSDAGDSLGDRAPDIGRTLGTEAATEMNAAAPAAGRTVGTEAAKSFSEGLATSIGQGGGRVVGGIVGASIGGPVGAFVGAFLGGLIAKAIEWGIEKFSQLAKSLLGATEAAELSREAIETMGRTTAEFEGTMNAAQEAAERSSTAVETMGRAMAEFEATMNDAQEAAEAATAATTDMNAALDPGATGALGMLGTSAAELAAMATEASREIGDAATAASNAARDAREAADRANDAANDPGDGGPPSGDPNAEAFLRGGLVWLTRQHGGLIPGLPRGRDHVPAMLDRGEFVVNAAATRAYLPLLETINERGRRFQGGGLAGGEPIPVRFEGTLNLSGERVRVRGTGNLRPVTDALV